MEERQMPLRVDEKVDGQEVFVYLPESHHISNLMNCISCFCLGLHNKDFVLKMKRTAAKKVWVTMHFAIAVYTLR